MKYKIAKTIISARKWVADNENIVVNTLTTIVGIGVFTLGVFLIGILEEITRWGAKLLILLIKLPCVQAIVKVTLRIVLQWTKPTRFTRITGPRKADKCSKDLKTLRTLRLRKTDKCSKNLNKDNMFKEITHKLQYEDAIVIVTTREFYSPGGNYSGTLYDFYNHNGWLTRGQEKYIDLEDHIRPCTGKSVRSSYSYNATNSIPISLVHYTRIVKNATPDWNEMQKCPAGDVLNYWNDPYCIVVRSYKPKGHFEGQPLNSKYHYDYPWKQVARRSYLWVVPFAERDCWLGRRGNEGYTLYPNRKMAIKDMYKK